MSLIIIIINPHIIIASLSLPVSNNLSFEALTLRPVVFAELQLSVKKYFAQRYPE